MSKLDHPINCAHQLLRRVIVKGRAQLLPLTEYSAEVSVWSNSVHFIELYPETREVLEWCVANSLVMTICSKSPDHNVIMAVMDAFEIWDWFLFPQIYSKQKSVHFQALTTLTGLPYTSFLFFDDNSANIKTCKEMGICSLLVDRSTGLNWESMVRGLDTYRNVEVSRSGIYSWLSSS
mmetsp:Transcript_28516/g.47897  ORF Transcript_28516/g.47897 Transcript_28516/m.47897 type:complete len:178 (+) Transcript_28516:170-703(+)